MSRTLSPEIEAAIASTGFVHFDAVEIELPFKDGDAAPIMIRAASASGVELLAPLDFLTFTYKAFTGAFGRAPTSAEVSTWDSALQTGFDTSPAALLTAASYLIDALFADTEYTDRMRSDNQFVGDIYMSYFGRIADPAGLAFWTNEVLVTSRAGVQAAFKVPGEFTDRVAGLNQPRAYDSDIHSAGSISLTDGVAIDSSELSLQNLSHTYSVPLAEPDRRLYPATATLKRAFKIADGTYKADTLITGDAQFVDIDSQAVKVQITSDMSRKGLNVVEEITQRCALQYKRFRCGSTDPSLTCSRIFDDVVNGCAQKMPAPQIIDTDPGVQQVETATVVGTITVSGNAAVIVTAAAMLNSPKTIQVPVANTDSASAAAGKIRTALVADADVGHVATGLFNVSGSGANIVLTTKRKKANDTTVNVSIANGTCTGLTAAPTSANTTAGVEGLNNQPRFKGVPPLASNIGPTTGLTPTNTGPSGWPGDEPFNPYDPRHHGFYGL